MKRRRLAAAVVSALAVAALSLITATSAAANAPSSAYKLKSFHRVGKNWTVETTSIDRSANAACQKADPAFYSKPKKGYVYVVVQFTGKKLTSGRKQNLGDGIITNLRAKDGKLYGQLYGIVAPHDASSSKAAGKNEKSSGGFTYEVKTSDAKAGHLEAVVEGTASSDDTPFFFAT